MPLCDFLSGARTPAFFNEDKIHNCNLIIEKLESLVGISLDHISARDLVNGDHQAVSNLLEIFSGLMEQLMDSIASDEYSEDVKPAEDPSVSTSNSEYDVLGKAEGISLIVYQLNSSFRFRNSIQISECFCCSRKRSCFQRFRFYYYYKVR